LVISSLWGLGLGLATAVASAIGFDLFVTPPLWSLQVTTGQFLATLATFLLTALLASAVAFLARSLAAANDARIDADLSAYFADLLLRTPDWKTALPTAARHLTRMLGLPSAAIEPGAVPTDEAHSAFPLHGDSMLATLIVPATLKKPTLQRLRDRAVPSLEMLLQAAQEREDLTKTQRSSYERLRWIAAEQAALRHLATKVAQGVPPSDVFDAVAREMAQVLGTPNIVIARYEPDGTAVVTAGSWNYEQIVASGTRWELEEGTISNLVFHTRAPERVNQYRGDGKLSTQLRERGVFSSVGCPIMVDCDLWGVAIASSVTPEPLPAGTEECMLEFTELAATAIANAQIRADLIASRARVVAATDETRRRIERDLHDGTQQNLVSIGLKMRTIETSMPPELDQLRKQLSETAGDLDNAVAELQKISRGLHPALVTKGGLRPALTTLARRSATPVQLNVSANRRLPEHVEVTIYYMVSEALTNVAKHANATMVFIDFTTSDELIRLSIRDDGDGGADPTRGSGLIGLIDRANALGGQMEILSPANGGTTLHVEIPRHENSG